MRYIYYTVLGQIVRTRKEALTIARKEMERDRAVDSVVIRKKETVDINKDNVFALMTGQIGWESDELTSTRIFRK